MKTTGETPKTRPLWSLPSHDMQNFSYDPQFGTNFVEVIVSYSCKKKVVLPSAGEIIIIEPYPTMGRKW